MTKEYVYNTIESICKRNDGVPGGALESAKILFLKISGICLPNSDKRVKSNGKELSTIKEYFTPMIEISNKDANAIAKIMGVFAQIKTNPNNIRMRNAQRIATKIISTIKKKSNVRHQAT